MRTKSRPFQFDDCEPSFMINMDPRQMTLDETTSTLTNCVSVNASPSDCNAAPDVITEGNQQQEQQQYTTTTSTSAGDNSNVYTSCSHFGQTADKCTQKDFNLEEQVEKRMRDLGTRIMRHESVHRQHLQKIHDIQQANFELHRQNLMFHNTLTSMSHQRTDGKSRRHPQNYQHYQQHVQRQNQRQQQALEHQQRLQLLHQQQQQQQQQQCIQQQVEKTTNAPQLTVQGMKEADFTATDVNNNNSVFVTQWNPDESGNTSEKNAAMQDQQQLQQQQQQQQQNEATQKIQSKTAKLSHRDCVPSMPPPLTCIATLSNSLTPQEHQMWQEFYRPSNTNGTHAMSAAIQHNQHHSSLVTPPPSPMYSSPPAATASHPASMVAAQYPVSPTYYPDPQSPAYYYHQQQQRYTSNTAAASPGINALAQRRHHPYQ